MNQYDDIEFLHHQKEKRRTLKRTLFFVCAVLTLLAGIIGFSRGSNATQNAIINKTSIVDHVRNFVFSNNRTIKGFKDDRVNILLLGVGGEGHEGPQLSDTMMLLSIKPSTKQIAILSIPRDLTVDIPNYGVKKINHANAYGEERGYGEGGNLAAEVVSQMIDLPVHYWIRIDFKAFEEIINKVGGVTIDVDQKFIDSKFPSSNSGYQTVQFDAGVQNMNGERALIYARSRHGTNNEDSDFARANRQQKIINALRKKLITEELIKNPQTFIGISQSILSHTSTNINPLAFVSLTTEVPDLLNQSATYHALTADQEEGLLKEISNEYGYFLVPRAGDFEEIALFVKNIFDIKQTISKKVKTTLVKNNDNAQANVVILNGTWEIGLAGKMRDALESNNIIIERIGNTENRTIEKTVIYILNNKNVTQRTLSRITPIVDGVVLMTSPAFEVEQTIDIVIVLGKDKTTYETEGTYSPR